MILADGVATASSELAEDYCTCRRRLRLVTFTISKKIWKVSGGSKLAARSGHSTKQRLLLYKASSTPACNASSSPLSLYQSM